MTLKQAVTSGTRIRRKGWNHYYDTNSITEISVENALADDWEAERLPITFECQWDQAYTTSPMYPAVSPWDQGADVYQVLKAIKGKRTKVTIEVLE